MMKYHFIAFALFLNVLTSLAQSISVESFYMDESDMTANTTGTIVFDQKGKKCALIKVETTQTGFSFDTGVLGVVKTEQHVGEIWVYVPQGVKRLTLSHRKYGVLPNYDLGLSLKRARTYIMKLSIPSSGAIDISSIPPLADIFIDEQYYGQTPFVLSKIVSGRHSIRLVREGYANYESTLDVYEDETTSVMAKMGLKTKISIMSNNPKATFYLDGVEQGTASGTKDTSFGTHEVRLVADGWKDLSQTIDISEQQNNFYFVMRDENSIRTITVKGVSFNMIKVEGGVYHDVVHTKNSLIPSFYIGETEVTQALWEAIMKTNPSKSKYKGRHKPVENVCWHDCQKFIEILNHKTKLEFYIPTEEEWLYAAGDGLEKNQYTYSGSNNVDEVAWYIKNSGYCTHNVKTKVGNRIGAYDMSGNVSELCSTKIEKEGRIVYVFRGGSFDDFESNCTLSASGLLLPEDRNKYVGFRLALKGIK